MSPTDTFLLQLIFYLFSTLFVFIYFFSLVCFVFAGFRFIKSKTQIRLTDWKSKASRFQFSRSLSKNPEPSLEAGVHLKALNRFNGNISFAFQAIQKPYTHYTNQCFGVFCKFLGIFGKR